MIAGIHGGPAIFYVETSDNVLVVRALGCDRGSIGDVLMYVLAKNEAEVSQDAQEGTVMHFYRRLRHLNYETIIRMAKDPASGISLADLKRENCLAYAQGKQTKNQQSRKDSGSNSKIDAIEVVILSDLKGPMTPKYRIVSGIWLILSTTVPITADFSWLKPKMPQLRSSSILWFSSKGDSTAEYTSSERTEASIIRCWICFIRKPS